MGLTMRCAWRSLLTCFCMSLTLKLIFFSRFDLSWFPNQYNSKEASVKLLYEGQPMPTAIASLSGETIVKVACGNNHTGYWHYSCFSRSSLWLQALTPFSSLQFLVFSCCWLKWLCLHVQSPQFNSLYIHIYSSCLFINLFDSFMLLMNFFTWIE